MEELTTMEIGFPSLTTSTIPTTTTINFGLPASLLQLYHTPVNTNELSIYGSEKIYYSPTWQKIQPTIKFPHSLPDMPKDLVELVNLQNGQNDGLNWSNQPLVPPPSKVTSPLEMEMEIEEPLPRPIPTRQIYNYCSRSREASVQSDYSNHSDRKSSNSPSGKKDNKCDDERAERRKQGNTASQARSRQHNKIIKDLYEENDKLIEEINQMYLKNGHTDPLMKKLLMNYKRLPKKERPYKKRGPPSSAATN